MKKIYVDISELAERDAGTGIQRVVKSLVFFFAKRANENVFFIKFINDDFYLLEGIESIFSPEYRCLNLSGLIKVKFEKGDKYLCLDLTAHLISKSSARLLEMQKNGVLLSFMVYDIAPLNPAGWFNEQFVAMFRSWFEFVASHANNLIFISNVSKIEFENEVENTGLRMSAKTTIIHLGADFGYTKSKSQLASVNNFDKMSKESRPYILAVGTIEPRKNYDMLLDAFEKYILASEFDLVIVGKRGWADGELIERFNKLQSDPSFFWSTSSDDAALAKLYQNCSALITTSFSEGFGLPLVEASYFNKPVICPRIPIFEEILFGLGNYFADLKELGSVLARLSNCRQLSIYEKPNTWDETGNELLAVLENM